MTIEEALEASAVELANDTFLVNPESRVITVPESEKYSEFTMTETRSASISGVPKSWVTI